MKKKEITVPVKFVKRAIEGLDDNEDVTIGTMHDEHDENHECACGGNCKCKKKHDGHLAVSQTRYLQMTDINEKVAKGIADDISAMVYNNTLKILDYIAQSNLVFADAIAQDCKKEMCRIIKEK